MAWSVHNSRDVNLRWYYLMRTQWRHFTDDFQEHFHGRLWVSKSKPDYDAALDPKDWLLMQRTCAFYIVGVFQPMRLLTAYNLRSMA